MTAKEKAMELIRKFSSKLPYYSEKDNLNKSKECALICADEKLKNCIKDIADIYYWKEVKEEINKL